MLRSIIKYSILLLFFVTALKAQNDGTGNTGLAFLKLGVTSRAVAMGESVVSITNDASATHYNPGALFNGSGVNVMLMHNAQVMGVRTEFLGAKLTFSKIALGFSLINTAVDNIQVREIPGEPIGEFTAQNMAIGVSFGYRVNPALTLGLTGKFLYEKIYIDNSSGLALDLGGLYQKDKLAIGLAVTNLGSMSELRNEATKLPSAVRLGGSYYFIIVGISSKLTVAADGYKVFDGGKFHANTGAEFLYKDFLAVRLGYQSGYENKSITTGLGLKYKAFTLDYAFVPYKFSQGSSHTITVGTNF